MFGSLCFVVVCSRYVCILIDRRSRDMWSRKDESFKMDSKREKFENQRENRSDLQASNAM